MICPRAVFITGANKGLGLEFARQFLRLDTPPQQLFATCRDPENAVELRKLEDENECVQVLKLDITCETDIESAARKVESSLNSTGLNLLINNAGVTRKRQYVGNLNKEHLLEQFTTNAIGPLLVTQSLLPMLLKASESRDTPVSCSKAAIVNISSILGSITENRSGGMYGYRPSKAALNMITKSLHEELKEKDILVTALHPGWVRTDIGGPQAEMSPEESVKACLTVLSKLSRENSGRFLSYTGEVIDW
ncbi:C-signal-like [Saccostrea cucullata]|uniref:C-signal-like n=1 Tax=Saccostrea cuccullata TaxID=36930 RepID=UPI002ED01B41